jgi:hypothetical protein
MANYWSPRKPPDSMYFTTDRNIRHQQNLTGRKIAVVVLGKGRWKLIKNRLTAIAAAVGLATATGR